MGTLGVIKLANFDPCRDFGRLTGWVLFDQFTDSRFDDLYLSQTRFKLGWAFHRNWEAGVLYTEPGHNDDVTLFSLAGVGTLQTNVRQAQAVSVYSAVAWYLSDHLPPARLGSQLGYLDDADSLLLGGNVILPLSDRVSLFAGALYEDEDAVWSGSTGLEFQF